MATRSVSANSVSKSESFVEYSFNLGSLCNCPFKSAGSARAVRAHDFYNLKANSCFEAPNLVPRASLMGRWESDNATIADARNLSPRLAPASASFTDGGQPRAGRAPRGSANEGRPLRWR